MDTNNRPESQQSAAERVRGDIVTDARVIDRLESLAWQRDHSDGFEDAAEQLAEQLAERVLSVDIIRTVDVTLATGGPAYGIRWEIAPNGFGEWSPTGPGRVWHQDWFTSKGFAELPDDVSESLFRRFGLEYIGEEN